MTVIAASPVAAGSRTQVARIDLGAPAGGVGGEPRGAQRGVAAGGAATDPRPRGSARSAAPALVPVEARDAGGEAGGDDGREHLGELCVRGERALDHDRALGADQLEADAGHQREIPGGGDGALAVGDLRLGHRPAVRAAGEGPRARLHRREEHDAVRQHRLDVGEGDSGVAPRHRSATIPARP